MTIFPLNTATNNKFQFMPLDLAAFQSLCIVEVIFKFLESTISNDEKLYLLNHVKWGFITAKNNLRTCSKSFEIILLGSSPLPTRGEVKSEYHLIKRL